MTKTTTVNSNRVTLPRPYSLISMRPLGRPMFHSCFCNESQTSRTPEERRRNLNRILQEALELVSSSEDLPCTSSTSSEKPKEKRENLPSRDQPTQ